MVGLERFELVVFLFVLVSLLVCLEGLFSLWSFEVFFGGLVFR